MKSVETADNFYAEIDEASLSIEEQRCLPQDLADRMAEAGLFRMLVPTGLGGGEVHPLEFFNTLARAAHADGSTGWNLMIGNTTSLLSASLPESWADSIYGQHPNVISVGVTAPIGRAEEVDGGMRVTGRWPFGSGSRIASWICGGATLYRNGEQVLNEHGIAEPLLVFFEADEVTIHDTWDTSGLRGTGSHDIEVTDQFVPEGRWVTLGKRARVDAPLYRFPTFGLLALGVSAVSMGIAQRAVAEFAALATEKTPTGATRSLANRTSAQKDIALATAQLEGARALTEQSINAVYDRTLSGERVTTEDKAKLRLAAANNAWSAAAVVDRLYHAAGGSAIYRKNKLQQCFRDVHVTTQHIMVGQPIFEVTGKVLLGLDPKQPL